MAMKTLACVEPLCYNVLVREHTDKTILFAGSVVNRSHG